MPYIDLAGLSRYASRQKDRLERDCALLRDMQWTRSEKAGAVSLWPVGGTPLEPSVDFLFTETPPAFGDKSPSNPSTITGVSSVKVTHGNKNYVSLPYHTPSRTLYDVEWTVNLDNSVTAVGTATQNSYFCFTGNETTNLRLEPNRKYFLHGCPSGGSTDTFRLGVTCGAGSFYSNAYDYGNGAVFIPKTHDANVIVFAQTNSGYSANVTFRAQLEDGETGTAIEVVPRNVYTIPLGNTFYGGTLDVASGAMTVTHGVSVIRGQSTQWRISTKTNVRAFFTESDVLTPGINTSAGAVCTHFPFVADSSDQVHFRLYNNGGIAFFYPDVDATAADFDAFLEEQYANGTPVTVVYTLSNSITVQLSPTEILSLTQTDKYTPRLNTVYTDAGAVQVGYIKSPIREEYELQQAVIAQGGNV